MYAYVAARAGQQAEFYEGSEWDPDHKEHRNPNVNKPRNSNLRMMTWMTWSMMYNIIDCPQRQDSSSAKVLMITTSPVT